MWETVRPQIVEAIAIRPLNTLVTLWNQLMGVAIAFAIFSIKVGRFFISALFLLLHGQLQAIVKLTSLLVHAYYHKDLLAVDWASGVRPLAYLFAVSIAVSRTYTHGFAFTSGVLKHGATEADVKKQERYSRLWALALLALLLMGGPHSILPTVEDV